MRACFLLYFVVSAVACSNGPTESEAAAVAGRYVLERVDGVSLPVAIEPGTECPREIVSGDMGLTPRINTREALYTVGILTAPRCEPPVPPARGTELLSDFGPWSLGNGRVTLRSERGFGTYTGQLGPGDAGGAGPVLTMQLGGRTYTFRRVAPFGV